MLLAGVALQVAVNAEAHTLGTPDHWVGWLSNGVSTCTWIALLTTCLQGVPSAASVLHA
jgi:hypothetical protein